MAFRLGPERDVPVRQMPAMKAAFPEFSARPNRRGGVTWTGELQPTADSPTYRIRIEHDPGRPKVFVERPHIATAPHRYADKSLCLYWPEEWRWHARRSLAATIVPWTALWLYFYEIWTETGKWMAPSSPHGTSKERLA